MAGKAYKLHLSRASCSFGNTENFINVGTDHGIYVFGNEQGDIVPLLNEGDCVAGVHIIHFGACGAFGNNADEAAEKLGSAPLFSSLFKETVGEVMRLAGTGVSACTACKPDICTKWQNTKGDYLVDGLPALTEDSFLTCRKGGAIRFVKSSGAAEPSPQEIVDSVNAVAPAVAAAPAVTTATPTAAASESNALGVGRQIYENHSAITEGIKDILGGGNPFKVIDARYDYAPWAENLAVQYATDRDMLDYNGDTPITWTTKQTRCGTLLGVSG
jgi:hypothetical protein